MTAGERSTHFYNVFNPSHVIGEVAAIGVTHVKWGERPLVFIVPTETQVEMLQPDSVIAHLRGRADRGEISKWVVPDRVLLVDAIDKTSSSKINKKALRLKYGKGGYPVLFKSCLLWTPMHPVRRGTQTHSTGRAWRPCWPLRSP